MTHPLFFFIFAGKKLSFTLQEVRDENCEPDHFFYYSMS
ncbi:hypothetical protein CHCC5023_3517 [Bacillus paralicheniformis]|nr:hypothetical protein CHCC5023_3517 [Bacillus paralicheniformis]